VAAAVPWPTLRRRLGADRGLDARAGFPGLSRRRGTVRAG
jgi:hypothetical protein